MLLVDSQKLTGWLGASDRCVTGSDMPNAPASLPGQLGDDAELEVEMAKKQMRGSAYYEERLKRAFPATYADLKAGKYRTVADAAIAAGLKKPRTRLHELKNAWTKADPVERADFMRWLGATGVGVPAPPSGTTSSPITVDRRLTTTGKRRIESIMSKQRLRSGDVMAELGYSRLNASVGMALARGTQIRPDVIAALEKWLAKNAAV